MRTRLPQHGREPGDVLDEMRSFKAGDCER
jgi:hypothetical protein